MKDLLKVSDKEILEEVRRLREGYKMKRILRYKTKRDHSVHSESNAEHTFALIYLAQYFVRVEPLGAELDKEKLYSLLLFHDFGEIKHGDVPTYHKTQADEELEREAAKEVFASLPQALQRVGYDYWSDYEFQKSPEAKFAFALDKVEPLFELLDEVNKQSLKNLKTTYEMNTGNKLRATTELPLMRRFVEVISKDMLDRGVFWVENPAA